MSKQNKKLSIAEVYHVGDFIDAKDSQGDWRVGYILEKNQNSKTYKIRFDGWASKYDELYHFNSHKLKQFRSFVTGYTGQKQNAGIRQSWKFTKVTLEDKMIYINQLVKKHYSLVFSSAHQLNQFFRGHNYNFVDFLMTCTYQDQDQFHRVIQFFKFQIYIACKHIEHISQNVQSFLGNVQLQNEQQLDNIHVAYDFAYYELFDMVFTINGSYPRLNGFFKDNLDLLRKQYDVQPHRDPKLVYQRKMVQLFINCNGINYINIIINKLLETSKSISCLFIYSLAHLYKGLSAVPNLSLKEQIINLFKKLAEKVIESLKDNQMKDFNQQQMIDLIKEIKLISGKTSLQKQISLWSQKMQLQVYLKMITCQIFQKKLRGITKLHQHIQQNQYLIKNGIFAAFLSKTRLFQSLFSSDNPQIIKKSTELLKYLYSKDSSMEEYILLVWEGRIGKHQTVVKEIYSFVGEIPLVDGQGTFTQELWQKNILLVEPNHLDPDFIKMLKDYTLNALAIPNMSRKCLFGFNIIYKYLQNNVNDQTTLNYLLQIVQKIENPIFIDTFLQDCFSFIQKGKNENLHISILLRIIKQKIADIKCLRCDCSSIIQKCIISSKNSPLPLSQQFELLNQILKQIKQVIVTQDFIPFWQEMINSTGKPYFFKWLLKIRDNGRVMITSYVNNQTRNQLLRHFWTQDYMNKYQQFQHNQALFLVQLLKAVNSVQGKIKRANVVLQVVQRDLIGLQKLHLAYEFCNNYKACSILAAAIAQIYMSEQNNIQITSNFCDVLIKRIFDKILIDLQNNSIHEVKKSITLIQEIIRRDQQIYDVNFILRSAAFKDFTIKNVENEQERTIRFNIAQSFYSLKKTIAQKFNLSIHRFGIYSQKLGQITYQSYFKTIFETGISQKLTLRKKIDKASEVKIELNLHLELLFQLLGNPEIQERVWSIVSKLPISDQLRQKIILNPDPLQGLSNESLYKQLYLFKVAVSLNEKWWHVSGDEIINFFLKKISRISARTQIQRQYLMISTKIILQIIQKQVLYTSQLTQKIIKSLLIMVKKLLIQTQQIQILSLNNIKHVVENFFSIGEKHNKLFDKQALLDKQAANKVDTLQILLTDKDAQKFLALGLVQYNHQKIRKEFAIRLAKLTQFNRQKHSESISKIIFEGLLQFSVGFKHKQHLRQLKFFACYVLEFIGTKLAELTKGNDEIYFSHLFTLIKNEIVEVSIQSSNPSLICYLSLIKYILPNRSFNELSLLFDFIYNECLFNGKDSKCKSKEAKSAAFSVLQKLIKLEMSQASIIDSFGKLHRHGLWRTRKLQDWVVMQSQRLKSTTGYTGLRNLGCICYMNSFFQQIFMVTDFRNQLLQAHDPLYNSQEVQDNVLYQVKKMFLNLMYSQKKAYNPKSFCVAFKDYQGNPTNVSQQMDIDEFSGILFDRLQNALKGTKMANLIKNTFGGVFSNQIICKGCPHFSQTQQSFLSLSLTVKDKKSIHEGLETMIKGDTLDGDNAYYCQRCDKKVSAVKRVCLKSLPDNLFVTLKRFQFDYMTMTKLKVNQYCEFPLQLNLQQYSYQYLRKQSPSQRQQLQSHPSQYFVYHLKGVVIHIGSSDSGHYYSLIQQRNSSAQWFQFNDTIVRKFNQQNLSEEAFGGETGGIQSKEKIKNAYMLVYQRQTKFNLSKDQMHSQKQIHTNQMFKQVFQHINQENHQYQIQSILFSPQYIQFISNLIIEAAKNKANIELQKFIILSFLTVILRSKSQNTNGWFQILQRMHKQFVLGNYKLCDWLIQQFSDVKIYDQFFRNNPVKEIKRTISYWLLQVMNQTSNQELKKRFMISIVHKVKISCQNTSQPITILFYQYSKHIQTLMKLNLIGILIKNIINPTYKNQIIQIEIDKQHSYLGYEQIVQKTAFQMKKMKYDNQSPYVWALINCLLSHFSPQYLCNFIDEQTQKALCLTTQKIYKIMQQLKNKFQIDVFTNYITYLCHDNLEFSTQMIGLVEKGIRDFQSKRYRQFFILFDKLIKIKDSFASERICWIHYVIRSLKQNQKYAMDCTIIQLWLCKVINQNQNLRQYLIKQRGILLYLQSLPIKKAPSDQLAKKNLSFLQSSVNKYHGIPYPSSRKGYLKILCSIQQFYHNLVQNKYFPLSFFESGNHLVGSKISPKDKLAYFDVKDKIQYEEVVVNQVFLHKLHLTRKTNNNKFWIWDDDQKLTPNLNVIKELQIDLDSSKTTEMEDQIDVDSIN